MIILMYVLNCFITLGNVGMTSVSKVEIKKSINELTQTAEIELPKNLHFTNDTQANVSDRIKRGDPVLIQLGYNGNLVTEFQGYILNYNLQLPLKIRCEDEMYKLKQTTFKKSWKSVTLGDVVNFIAPNYKTNIIDPNINLGSFQINNASPAKVLQEIKQTYGLKSFFKDGVLQVGFPFDFVPSSNKLVYDFQRNVRKNNLEYVTAEDYKIKIKAISHLKDGKTRIVWYPSKDAEGDIRTRNYTEVSESDLLKMAKSEHQKFNYDGYRGTISGFGIPFLQPGDAVTLRDNYFLEKKGRYLIESTNVMFDTNGFERTCTIGKIIS